MKGVAVISIHDVAPATFDRSRWLLDTVERVDLRASLLVIPGPFGGHTVGDAPDFTRWLLAAEQRGHEVVVHGWEHRAVDDPASTVTGTRRVINRLVARGCAEFGALGFDEAAHRARSGLDALRAIGASPIGFTPPGWLISNPASWALREAGFEYTTTRPAVHDLRDGRRLEVPAYAQRSQSLLTRPGATVVESIVRSRLATGRSVRLALHPADADHARLRASTGSLVVAIASSRARPMVYADLVDGARSTIPRRMHVPNGGR